MIFVFLLWNLVPSAYWGATGFSVVAPLLWSLVGGIYAAAAKWRTRDRDIELAWQMASRGRISGLVPTLVGAALTGVLFSAVLNTAVYLIASLVVRSAGATKVLIVVSASYLVTGLHYALRDLSRPIISQPAYVRGPAFIRPLAFGMLTWLPGTLGRLRFSGGRPKYLKEPVSSFVLFASLICMGLLF
jgi:hypothetical protein